jgi:hypothetical protein
MGSALAGVKPVAIYHGILLMLLKYDIHSAERYLNIQFPLLRNTSSPLQSHAVNDVGRETVVSIMHI